MGSLGWARAGFLVLSTFLSSKNLSARSRAFIDLASSQTIMLPLQEAKAPGGREILRPLMGQSLERREQAILSALEAGHFPDFMRVMRPVTVVANGQHLVFWVMPDYVAVGNNEDFVLTPLSFIAARQLAKQWGMLLPTTQMVDAIFEQAKQIIWPKTYKPEAAMTSVEWLMAHNQWIQDQHFAGRDLTQLVAGHKKDIVLSKKLQQFSQKIAIYGWQNIRGGENIQPLSTWHGERYVDYSHGVRMIGPLALLNGKPTTIKSILANPDLCHLLSREGPLSADRLLGEEPRFAMGAR